MRKQKHMGGTFGAALKSLRMARGITLRDLSASVNIDPGNYSRMENGINPPPRRYAEFQTICIALKASKAETADLAKALRDEQAWWINHRAKVKIDRLNREFS